MYDFYYYDNGRTRIIRYRYILLECGKHNLQGCKSVILLL